MKKTKKPTKPAKKQSAMALAAALGVSRSTLYTWREAGAPVDGGEAEVLRWAMKNAKTGHDTDDVRKARLAVLLETARRLKLANDERDKLTLNKIEVRFAMAQSINLLFSTLDRLANVDWPPSLRGLNEQQICTVVKAGIEKLKDEFRAGLEKLLAEPEVKP